MDLLQLFVEAFANRTPHPDDLSLARRLLTHPDAERIVAGLLRDHLGARGGDAPTEAAEARRARNPPPVAQAPRAAPVEERRHAPRRADADRTAHHDARTRAARAQGGSGEGARRGAPVASYRNWEPPEEPDDERPILAEEDDTTSPLPRFTVEGEGETRPRAERPPRSDRADRGRARSDGDRDEAAPGLVQLFVNVGKREGVRPGDIQKILADAGVPDIDAGRIRVRDRMTFVDVKKEVFERAVAALAGQVFGGRTVVAELARGRS
jgi:ATP-dependent RNA helicase DeaD